MYHSPPITPPPPPRPHPCSQGSSNRTRIVASMDGDSLQDPPPPPATFESPSLSVATVVEKQLQPLMKDVTSTLFKLCASFFPQSVSRVSLSSLCQCVSFFRLSTVYDSSLCQCVNCVSFFPLSTVYHSSLCQLCTSLISVNRVSFFHRSAVYHSSLCQMYIIFSLSQLCIILLSVVCQSSFCQLSDLLP